MKRIHLLLLLLAVPAGAAYIPGPAVDSTTYTLGTTPEMPVGGVVIQNPTPLVNTSTTTAAFRMTPYRSLFTTPSDANGVILGTSTANPLIVNNSGVTQPVSGTVTAAQSVDAALNASVSLKGSSNTVQVTGNPGVSQSGTWTVQPGNTQNTTPWLTYTTNLTTAALQVQNGAGALTSVGWQTGGSSVPVHEIGTVSANITNTPAVSQSGSWNINSLTSITNALPTGTNTIGAVNDKVLVSSATAMPTAAADATQTGMMGDKFGRVITMPIAPWGLVQYATATLTTTTTEIVFISSAGANTYTHLVGCIGENTSATATDITFRQTGPSATNTNSFKIGMSASSVPVGFMSLGPFGIQKVANSNWTIQGGASVTSLHITCAYYQTP